MKPGITRIWMSLAEDSVSRITGDGERASAPDAQKALDHATGVVLAYLRGHGLEVDTGHDGSLRTLDFKNESDCLDAHERLTAAAESQGDFKLRFVLRPSGVTIVVVT